MSDSRKKRNRAVDKGWSSKRILAPGASNEIISMFSGKFNRVSHGYFFSRDSCSQHITREARIHVHMEVRERLCKEGVKEYSLTICELPDMQGILVLVSVIFVHESIDEQLDKVLGIDTKSQNKRDVFHQNQWDIFSTCR